jgi:hypothetical protein
MVRIIVDDTGVLPRVARARLLGGLQLLESEIHYGILCRVGQKRRIRLNSVGGAAVEQLLVHISAELHASGDSCPEHNLFQAHRARRICGQLANALSSLLDFFRSELLNFIHERHHFKNPKKRWPVSKVRFETHNAIEIMRASGPRTSGTSRKLQGTILYPGYWKSFKSRGYNHMNSLVLTQRERVSCEFKRSTNPHLSCGVSSIASVFYQLWVRRVEKQIRVGRGGFVLAQVDKDGHPASVRR